MDRRLAETPVLINGTVWRDLIEVGGRALEILPEGDVITHAFRGALAAARSESVVLPDVSTGS